jgi:glycolate dehydrogenase FAD-binding subunit
MDLIHPSDEAGVIEALHAASATGGRVRVVGGRRHMRGTAEAGAELWTTGLDRVIAHDPAEMLCVVEAGMRLGDLQRLLAEGGQEWPVDEPDDATVGGVIAADVALPRQLRVGCLRDTVVEMTLVTGDGRRIRSGARTVKNVTGYDLHRLLTGSAGTLGVITQVAIKVRPLPKAARTLVTREGGLDLAGRLLDGVPLPATVLAEHDRVLVRLEGWPEEVAEQARLANGVAVLADADPSAWLEPAFPEAAIVARAAVAPSKLSDCIDGHDRYRALVGVGYAWMPCPDADAFVSVREQATSLGGMATPLGATVPIPAADVAVPELQARIRAAFDPAGVLAPT